MPHQCTTCGRTFPDGSKEMLSGCPDCGGNKFQFKPAGETSAEQRSPAGNQPSNTDPQSPDANRQSPDANRQSAPVDEGAPTRVPAVSPTLPLPIPNGLTPNRPRLGRQTLGHQNPRHRTLRRPTQNTSATGPKRMSRKRARARMSSRPTSSIGRVEISKRIRPRPGLIPTHRQIRRARVPISTTSETSSTSSSRAFGS